MSCGRNGTKVAPIRLLTRTDARHQEGIVMARPRDPMRIVAPRSKVRTTALRAAAIGAIARLSVFGALGVPARREGRSAVAPINATSHVVHSARAGDVDSIDRGRFHDQPWGLDLLGAAIHLVALPEAESIGLRSRTGCRSDRDCRRVCRLWAGAEPPIARLGTRPATPRCSGDLRCAGGGTCPRRTVQPRSRPAVRKPNARPKAGIVRPSRTSPS